MGIAYQLLGQRDLLELHLVDAGRSGAEQRGGCEEHGALHDGGGAEDELQLDRGWEWRSKFECGGWKLEGGDGEGVRVKLGRRELPG